MKHKSTYLLATLLVSTLFFFQPGNGLFAGHSPQPLNILVTNDDGYNAPGIQALRAALIQAGHYVTVIAPLENQSGKGATIEDEEWVAIKLQEPGVWSVDNTPVMSVRVGLDAIMADNPPDLVISGINFGQNLGQISSVSSGTMCAALMGLYKNVPAIACSAGILIDELSATPIPCPSTFAAFPHAADFMVRLVEQLQVTSRDGRILPPRTMLNVNFPVPYDQINDVKVTRLGQYAFADVGVMDPYGAIPGGEGTLYLYYQFFEGPDPVSNSDYNAFQDYFIAISIIDGDMTADIARFNSLKHRLFHIQP